MTISSPASSFRYQFRTKPYDHQLDDLKRSWSVEYWAWLWEMGLGKSKQLCDNIGILWDQGLIDAAFILCWPKQLMYTWAYDQLPVHLKVSTLDYTNIVTWDPNPKAEHFNRLASLFEPRKDGLGKLDILIMNSEALSTDKGHKFAERFLKKHKKVIFGIDESTRIKSTGSKVHKRAVKLGRLESVKYRRIMTGTPATESPLDIYGQYEFLREGLTGHWSPLTFRNDFCTVEKKYQMITVRGVAVRKEYPAITGYKNLDRLNRVLVENGSRLTKAQCLDLPPKVYKKVYVELSAKQRAAYDELVREAVLELSEEDLVTAPMVVTRLLYLRQITCNLARADETKKVYWIDEEEEPRAEAVEDILKQAGSQQALVWGVFVPSLERLAKRLRENLKTTVGLIHGGVPADQRQKLIEDFQAGRIQHLVQQERTGGYGTTLTNASVVVYHDNDWSLETRLQSEDRAHRIGQDKTVVYWDVVVKDTVDEDVIRALVRKDGLALQVTGDDWRRWIR